MLIHFFATEKTTLQVPSQRFNNHPFPTSANHRDDPCGPGKRRVDTLFEIGQG